MTKIKGSGTLRAYADLEKYVKGNYLSFNKHGPKESVKACNLHNERRIQRPILSKGADIKVDEGHVDDLLEYLTFKTGCMYMSDLPRCWWRLPSAIRNIPENRYPVTAWDEAVAYIYRVNKRFRTVKEAKEFILSWSSKSASERF